MRRKVYFSAISLVAIVVVAGGLSGWSCRSARVADRPPATAAAPSPEGTPDSEEIPLAVTLARELEVPWALDFLPAGGLVFTERVGRVRLLDARAGLLPEPMLTLDQVVPGGEGGLLGIAVHPDFARNRFIYLYYTYQGAENLANGVVRFREENKSLLDAKVIIDNIPAASIHNGGRLKFGPDGLLYITTGDAAVAELAQHRDSLAGKILRLNDDGSIPSDNPFPGSPVYSWGHRNPQGLAWDDRGRLWATEHGSQAADELNLIEPGKNYGWPIIRGGESAPGLEPPVMHSGGETWAPSGLAWRDGSLFFAGLRGQSLYRVLFFNELGDDSPSEPVVAVAANEWLTLRRHLSGSFGRLRDVVVGPDGWLYILTSNRDGRGSPAAADDQIIRVNPGKLD